MLPSISLCLALLLSFLSGVSAVPQSHQTFRKSISLFRKPPSLSLSRTEQDWGLLAKYQREHLMMKYGATLPRKRSTGTNLITNQNADSSFYGSLAIGSPPSSFNVILDTGSADLWVATTDCNGCGDVPAFTPSSSSSFKNSTSMFDIHYGSGQASGVLGQDVVEMAGFFVPNQLFGLCNQVSEGLLNNPVSGILGLAFQTIAQSGTPPFWETLAQSDALDSPVMSFHLTRFLSDNNAHSLEPGGSFTMGFANTTLYSGNIEYLDIPPGQTTYWILPLASITVQAARFVLPNDPSSYAAIDTGTTLVGGPTGSIQAIYSQIPGAVAGTGDMDGYYTYPCATAVNISLSFGRTNWRIDGQDFKLTDLGNGRCVGAFFSLKTGSNAPNWIIGDTFLKNVYSVFRYSPPSVGFAQLSETALAMNGVDGAPPSPTIATAAATVSATSEGSWDSVVNGVMVHVANPLGGAVAALATSLLAACI